MSAELINLTLTTLEIQHVKRSTERTVLKTV